MRPRLAGLALSLVFSPLAWAQAPAPLGQVRVEYQPPTLLVHASVNGSKPLLFAFDTGATTCLVDTAVARKLGIKPAAEPDARGLRSARARTLAIGRAEAYDLELVVRDLSALSHRVGRPLAGIIGFTWMEQFVFRVSLRAGTLTLWPRSAELVPGSDELPLPLELHTGPGFTGAALFVPAQLQGRERCSLQLDTGTDTVVLGQKMAERLGLATKSADQSPATLGRLDLAGRAFVNVAVLVDPQRGADGNPYAQCLIGNAQLKEFVLTVDIPRRRVFFRALSPLPEAE